MCRVLKNFRGGGVHGCMDSELVRTVGLSFGEGGVDCDFLTCGDSSLVPW